MNTTNKILYTLEPTFAYLKEGENLLFNINFNFIDPIDKKSKSVTLDRFEYYGLRSEEYIMKHIEFCYSVIREGDVKFIKELKTKTVNTIKQSIKDKELSEKIKEASKKLTNLSIDIEIHDKEIK